MKTKKKKGKKKGFTLIELLVVIAIIAILSIVVVLTLNPAEMLRRSRDSNRVSDLSVIKTAIGLYLADVSSTSMGNPGTCYLQESGAAAAVNIFEFPSSTPGEAGTPTTIVATTTTACAYWFGTETIAPITSTNRSVNSTGGWIPINLSLISTGAPIGQWPADPAFSGGASVAGNANAGHFYSYIPVAANNAYKLAAKMESALYSYNGSSDVEGTDGGIDPNMYEQGTNLTL